MCGDQMHFADRRDSPSRSVWWQYWPVNWMLASGLLGKKNVSKNKMHAYLYICMLFKTIRQGNNKGTCCCPFPLAHPQIHIDCKCRIPDGDSTDTVVCSSILMSGFFYQFLAETTVTWMAWCKQQHCFIPAVEPESQFGSSVNQSRGALWTINQPA